MGRKPVVVEGLVCAEPAVMAWADGEQERWLARAAALDHGREEPGWVTAATGADRLSNLSLPQVAWLFAKGPEASARALLATPVLLRCRQRMDLGRVAAARFDLDALPYVLHEAGDAPDGLGVLVLPFRAPPAATLVAGWLRHLGSARLWARLWLARHPEMATRALIPAAAGRPGKARQNAEDALRYLAAIGHQETISQASSAYGVGTALTFETPVSPPVRKAPAWLPDVPPALLDALSRSRLADPTEPPPGDPAPPGRDLPLAVESSAAAQPFVEPLDSPLPPGSAEFGRTLLDAWLAAGMPASEAWVLLAQAHLGDDATMDRLAPLIKSWPAKSRWTRAIDGFAVLATAGTDVSLRHLLAIEAGMVGGATNERALVYLAQAAARRGLSVIQLADRLAITHGLENEITLDYGPRKFTVATDEHLHAYVVDADGRRLARPPKPGVRDTNPEAYASFLSLKKELRATAAAQIARLEREMLARRRRPARDLPAVLLPHPVLGPLARRLLWGEYDEDRLVRALRIAEDGSFADLNDAAATVAGDAPLGLVHPVELGGSRAVWGQIFADYEILQPFPQLHRPAVALTADRKAATSLPGFGPVPSERIAALLNGQHWRSNAYLWGPTAGREHTQLARDLPGGTALVVEFEPGVATSGHQAAAEQRITEIWADHAWSDHFQVTRHMPMGACDPIALSESLVFLRDQTR